MRYLTILFFTGVAALAQPTVHNVRVDYATAPNGAIPHSSVRILWSLNTQACYHRIQFGQTTSYGNITAVIQTCQTNDLGLPLSGLKAATTYYYQVQSGNSSTGPWSTGGTGSFTTAALPNPHPAPPQISNLWNPMFPSTAGYLTATVGANCTAPTLNSLIATAVTNQPTNGTVITIPAGTTCPSIQFPNDTQILTVPQDSAHVNTATGVFTATSIPSGWTLTNGQTVMLAAASCLPGALTQGNGNNAYNGNTEGCVTQGPLTTGVVYYLVGVSGSTFQLSATSGGSPIIPGDIGTPSTNMQMEQWPPQNSNWIVVQTSTADSTFCPQGVRCMGSIWASKMAKVAVAGGLFNRDPQSTGIFTHNVWFRGIELTSTDVSSLANSTVDPEVSNYFYFAPYSWKSAYIVFDRSYIHCQAFPNRCTGVLNQYGGAYMAVINSDLEGLDYWRPYVSPGEHTTAPGLSGTLAGQILTLTPGSANLGPINTCTSISPITLTVTGGTASGTAYVYLASNCTPTVVMPTGMTGTCTGSSSDSNSNSHYCSVTTSPSPGWFYDSSNGIDCLTIGTFALTSGVASSYTDDSTYPLSTWDSEGTQAVLSGQGPGPISYLNNYWEGTGLLLHFDDSSIVDPQQVWIRQNTFVYNQAHKTGWSGSNGYRYANRNGPELKHGRQIKFDGNTVTGAWADVSATGPWFLAHTAANQGTTGTAGGLGAPGYTIQDVDITNNTCSISATCFEVGGGVMNMTPFPAAARIRIKNNLVNQSNGYTQADGNANVYLGQSNGNWLELDGAIEDLIVDHNTVYDNRGDGSGMFWHHQAAWIEGCQVTNNIWWFNNNAYGITSEEQQDTVVNPVPDINSTGSILFNKECTNDPNVPGGIMTNNLAVPYYSTSGPGTPSGYVTPSSICTSFGGTWGTSCTGGLINLIQNNGSAAANLAAIGFESTQPGALNLRLRYNSPYASGAHVASDRTDLGADTNALLAAQGAVGTPTVTVISSTTATISWFAYDGTVACSVDYAVAPNDPSTQSGGGRASASLGNSQAVSLTGLSPGTQYNYRVLCPVQQPTGSFITP